MTTWPQISIDTEDATMCFGCGQNNPIGLKLNFVRDGKTVRSSFTPGELHQGWTGIVHGGIIECLLDEAMSYAAYFDGIRTITARMQIRMKRPAIIGETLTITASITRKNPKLVETEGAISLADGTPVADSAATLFIYDSKQNAQEKDRNNDRE